MIMAILPAPAGYTAIRLAGNYQVSSGNAKVLPTGSYVYVPTERASAFCSASGSSIVSSEPELFVYTQFGNGDGKWDGC
jgi:hypothetical protein